MAIETDNKQPDDFKPGDENKRRRVRRGQFFGKNQSLKGGHVEIKTLTLKDGEVTFLLGANGGIMGQIFTRPGDPDVDGAGVDTVMEFINITGDAFKFTGDPVPSVDDAYSSGYSTLAWQYVYSNNPFQNVSDGRTKKDIKDIEKGLAEILKLRPVSFVKIKDKEGRTQLGLIAQEAKEVLPEVVWGSEDEIYTVGYDAIIPVLVKAIQEMNAKIIDLESRLNDK